MRPRLASVQTGRPRVIATDHPWVTSIYKAPVEGPVQVRTMNIDGDEQADLTVHGGLDKAICVYGADHYAGWRHELLLPTMGPGAFGENFTVALLAEGEVSIGDQWKIGEAVVEVSQPRSPCWKLAQRWGRPDLPKRVIESGRTGWYLRVVREGVVEAGQDIEVVARPGSEWTIARVNDIAYGRADNVSADQLAALTSWDRLAESWRLWLAKRRASITAPRDR